AASAPHLQAVGALVGIGRAHHGHRAGTPGTHALGAQGRGKPCGTGGGQHPSRETRSHQATIVTAVQPHAPNGPEGCRGRPGRSWAGRRPPRTPCRTPGRPTPRYAARPARRLVGGAAPTPHPLPDTRAPNTPVRGADGGSGVRTISAKAISARARGRWVRTKASASAASAAHTASSRATCTGTLAPT